jgi:hypothetical protein
MSIAVGMLAIILAALLLKRIRKAHFYWDADVLALIGLPVFSYLLLRSRAAYRKGTISWKGRRYSGNGDAAPSDEVRANKVRARRPHDSRQDAGATSSHATST